MKRDTNFKLELIAEEYSNKFDIGKKLIYLKGQEYYSDFYKKLPEDILATVDAVKKMKKFCERYK